MQEHIGKEISGQFFIHINDFTTFWPAEEILYVEAIKKIGLC